MKKTKRLSKGAIIAIALGGVIFTGLIVYAAYLYFSNERINQFSEGEADVEVIENEDSDNPIQTGTQPFTWAKENELDENSDYSVVKKVRAKSMTDDQFVRVQIVPSWRDSDGNICTPEYISDFGYITVENGELLFKRTQNSEPTITCVLAGNYSDYWAYDSDSHCFIYNELLPKGSETELLMTSVKISKDVYAYTYDSLTDTEYELYVDVLVDSVEQYGKAKQTRWEKNEP